MSDEVLTTATAEVETTQAPAEEKKTVTKKPAQKKFTRSAKGKRRETKSVPRGRAYIQATINNTIITVTDPNGNVIAWSSAGNCGFKGPKKATPYAASVIVGKVAEKLEPLGTKDLAVFVKGIGNGRDSAIRTLNSKGFNIISIKETTAQPHNGCRPRRARRV